MFFGVYLSTQDLLGRHTCEKTKINRTKNFKCRSAFGTGVISCTGRVKRQSEEKLGGEGEKEDKVRG